MCTHLSSLSFSFLLVSLLLPSFSLWASPTTHFPSFPRNKKFKGFFPRHLLDGLTSRLKFSDWETRVLEEYDKQSGKPEMIAQLLYLQLVRQWPVYGSTFFIACLNIPPKGFFEHRTENLYIAVNSEGITITDADKVVRAFFSGLSSLTTPPEFTLFSFFELSRVQKVLHAFTYDDIIWDATKDTFVIEHGPDGALQELTLITPQGSLIASLVTKAIKNLDKNDRRSALSPLVVFFAFCSFLSCLTLG